MGSSPVTATISPPPEPSRLADLLQPLLAALTGCLRRAGGLAPSAPLVVAFSGGTDSTALLLAATRLTPDAGAAPPRVVAAHVDHRLDGGSPERAAAAARLAAHLGVPFHLLVAPPGGDRDDGASPEAAARRQRYALLAALCAELGGGWLLTAHHAGDQAETVLLRLALGSGLAGLAGIPARHGQALRPLLTLEREQLAAVVAAAGLQPVEDPTNADLRVPRNLLRHRLLPALGGPAAAARARAVGAAAAGLAASIEHRLLSLLPELAAPAASRVRVTALRALPDELLPWALALLHRRAGAGYPPRRSAVAELRRQLARGAVVGCDCGGGWRWRADRAGWLVPSRVPAASAPFAYTVAVPGGVEIRESGTTFRLTQEPVAAWMRRGSPAVAALDLPLSTGEQVTVRSRLPGDRLQPLGSSHRRRLKDLLIDHKVPRETRDHLPLLCVAGQVAWVPGVTIHHPFRLREGADIAWVAELLPRRE